MIDRTAELAIEARRDMELLSYPTTAWVDRMRADDDTAVHAVIVIGAGQSGLAVAASLRREGVDDVLVLDRQPRGYEGVWETFARMRELRTPKAQNGMDFGCPSLSVQRWFAARFGSVAAPAEPLRMTVGTLGSIGSLDPRVGNSTIAREVWKIQYPTLTAPDPIVLAQHRGTHAFLVQHVGRGYGAVFENQFAGIRAAHAELVEFLRCGKARHAALDDEGGDAARTQLRVHRDDGRAGEEDAPTRVGGSASELFE